MFLHMLSVERNNMTKKIGSSLFLLYLSLECLWRKQHSLSNNVWLKMILNSQILYDTSVKNLGDHPI